jgi:hypothetical protein
LLGGEIPVRLHLSDHIQPTGTLHPCESRDTCGEHDSTLKALERTNIQANTSGRMRGVSRETRRVKKPMPLIQLLEVLVVVGVLLWLVNRFIPMQGTIKSILNGVVVIAVVLWIMNAFGLFQSLSRIHVGT